MFWFDGTMLFLAKALVFFFKKLNKYILAPQIIMNSYQSQRQVFMPNFQMLFTSALSFVKFFDPC